LGAWGEGYEKVEEKKRGQMRQNDKEKVRMRKDKNKNGKLKVKINRKAREEWEKRV
jgi:hypothetical protein